MSRLPGERTAPSARRDPDGKRQRVLLIVNPFATSVLPRARERVLGTLDGAFDLEVVDTDRPGHATQLAAQASDSFDLIVVLGGDGTVNEVANGLAGTAMPMTALPGGSTSVFARLLGYPTELAPATEALIAAVAAGAPRSIDLGRVSDRYFTFTSGLGFDASVVARIDARPALKKRFRHAYAAYAGLATALREYSVHAPEIEVRVDGTPAATGVSVMVQNAEIYSFFGRRPLHVARGAQLDSGTLAGAILTSARPSTVPGITRRVLSSTAEVADHARVESFAGAGVIELTADRPVALHVDGDHIGDVQHAHYSVAPGALLVVGPTQAAPGVTR